MGAPRNRKTESNVVAFPAKKPAYSLHIISEKAVNGMLLIEACIPVQALDVLETYLKSL